MSQALVIDRPSNGAQRVAEALGARRVRIARVPVLRHNRYINWGCSTPFTARPGAQILNQPRAVATAVSKTRSFAAVGDLAPAWSTTPQRMGDITLARRDGLSCGRGIQIIRDNEEVPGGFDFYTKYVRKLNEYRVHVAEGRAIFVQQKRRRSTVQQTADQQLIRNHENGWVFCENNITFDSPEVELAVKQAAIDSVSRIGLDFGAVDLVVEKGTKRVYFLEVNTRPGIESSRLLSAYRDVFTLGTERR